MNRKRIGYTKDDRSKITSSDVSNYSRKKSGDHFYKSSNLFHLPAASLSRPKSCAVEPKRDLTIIDNPLNTICMTF